MDLLKAVIFGVIEGLTEWLPISSTGHMILADEWIKMDLSAQFMEMFLVVIQFGAILAVIVLYFQKLNPFSRRKSPRQKSETVSLWMKVLCACVPAGVIGVLFDDQINAAFYNFQTVAVTLILYGVLFIVVENRNRGKIPSIRNFPALTYRTAFFIGIFQVLALIPGTSRSGATILGAILIGTSREIAAEFTFFLAIPVMLGASFLKMVKFGFSYTQTEVAVLLFGMVTAFLVSIFAIRFLMGYIKKHDFKPFGYYRIVLGAVVLLYFGMMH
jgi:undecaprenyl-diphosphatase